MDRPRRVPVSRAQMRRTWIRAELASGRRTPFDKGLPASHSPCPTQDVRKSFKQGLHRGSRSDSIRMFWRVGREAHVLVHQGIARRFVGEVCSGPAKHGRARKVQKTVRYAIAPSTRLGVGSFSANGDAKKDRPGAAPISFRPAAQASVGARTTPRSDARAADYYRPPV